MLLAWQRAETRDGVKKERELYGAFSMTQKIAELFAAAAEPKACDEAEQPTDETQRRSGERFDAGFSQEGRQMFQGAGILWLRRRCGIDLGRGALFSAELSEKV